MRIFSGCKINLGLKIKGKLSNGYHLIESCFFPLQYPADFLILTPQSNPGMEIDCNVEFDGPNILTRVWEEFSQNVNCKSGLKIFLHKHIPHGAGLGGGSGNAAALLVWLNKFYGEPLDKDELFAIGEKIGADVPFFIERKPAFVHGIGEKLCRLEKWPQFWITLVWPQIHISTKTIFEEYDKRASQKHNGSLTNLFPEYKKKFVSSSFNLFDNLGNDLQETAIAIYPELANLKKDLEALKPDFSVMSGSGSAFYGIFFSETSAKYAANILRKKYKYVYLVPVLKSGL